MARKINLSDAEKAQIKQKNAERRDSLYHLPHPKFNFNESDMNEAMEPLTQVSGLITRLKNQNAANNSSKQEFDHEYSPEMLALLDNDTSILSNQPTHKDTFPVNDTGNITGQDKLYSLSKQVAPSLVNEKVTRTEESQDDPSTSLTYSNINKLTTVYTDLPSTTEMHSETSSKDSTYSINDTSIPIVTDRLPLNETQKYKLIHSIFLYEKSLSNVERNFLVSLFLEMNFLSERLSLNNIIKKYEFRKATIYQLIPHIANLGLIQIVTDNSPKGSIIDVTRLLNKYNIPLCYDNETSNTDQLVNNKNNMFTNLTNQNNIDENVTTFKLDPTRRMLVKNSILYLFKSMMLIDAYRKLEVYNEKSIKIFAEYLIKNNVSHVAQMDLLGLAIYSAEKTKKSERVIYYLHNTLENGGIESLQIAFKEKANDFLEFSNIFYDIDFEEPSLKDIKDYCKQLNISDEQPRALLVSLLIKCRKDIEENIIVIERIIDSMPEFRR